MPTEHSFEIDDQPTEWLVEPLVPLGQFNVFLSQAGVGKSLLLEDLAVHVVYEVPFCGFKTKFGDVLLIDQDTPTELLSKRINKFGRALELMGAQKKHKLIIASYEGYSLVDKTLDTIVNDYPSTVLTVIDSMHSVCERLNPNNISDMNKWGKFKERCIRPDMTVAVNHHITEKRDLPVDKLMTDNPHSMSMGSSALMQQADTYYIVGASADNGMTNKIYVRPVAKRAIVRSTPVILQMVQPDEYSERLEFFEDWSIGMTEEEIDCLSLFKDHNADRTIKEIFDQMGQQHSIDNVRKALKSLRNKGKLIRSSHAHNLFKYRLP